MATIQASNTKGRNVEPLSSVLDMNTLSVDASGLTVPPLDGEWVFFKGDGKACTNAAADITYDGTDTGLGALACMVWSEKGRSDLQSLGRKKVPVIFRKSFHCKLHLYQADDTNLPGAGCLITLAAPAVAIDGSTARLVADVTWAIGASGLADLAAGTHWVVGYVIGGPGLKGGTSGEPLEVYLYDSPRAVTSHA